MCHNDGKSLNEKTEAKERSYDRPKKTVHTEDDITTGCISAFREDNGHHSEEEDRFLRQRNTHETDQPDSSSGSRMSKWISRAMNFMNVIISSEKFGIHQRFQEKTKLETGKKWTDEKKRLRENGRGNTEKTSRERMEGRKQLR